MPGHRSQVTDLPVNGSWAEVYDSAYSDIADDIPFYVDLAANASGAVLELGCGTGRVTIPIAKAGVDIVGVEASPDMLSVARRKVGSLPENSGSVTLVQAPMNDFAHEVDRRFHLVLIPFSGFLSLLTAEDQERALRSIFRSLAPGGRLALDVTVPEIDALTQDGDVAYHLRDSTDPYTGKRYVIWRQGSYDEYDQVESVRTTFEELDESGSVCRRTLRDFQIRYIYRREMQYLLTLSGFQVLDLFGDFDRSPFDRNSTQMIWIAGARS